jgi:hypothetical protein
MFPRRSEVVSDTLLPKEESEFMRGRLEIFGPDPLTLY